MMKCPDSGMSRVKKKRRLMLCVRSSSNDRDNSTCSSSAFNLDRYNSPDQWLRLNHFTTNRRQIRCRHVPLGVSDIQRTQFNRAIGHLSLYDVTCN